MNAQRDVSERVRAAEYPGERARQRCNARTRNDCPHPPMDRGNFAQHLRLCHGRIIPGKRVAASDPLGAVLRDQTMDEEPTVARDQHDVSGNEVLATLALDAENVARPDRRKHAGSQCLEADFAPRIENFGGKVEFMSFTSLCRDGHGWPKLRTLAIETALKFCGACLAAG
jgi:hypothetical protein